MLFFILFLFFCVGYSPLQAMEENKQNQESDDYSDSDARINLIFNELYSRYPNFNKINEWASSNVDFTKRCFIDSNYICDRKLSILDLMVLKRDLSKDQVCNFIENNVPNNSFCQNKIPRRGYSTLNDSLGNFVTYRRRQEVTSGGDISMDIADSLLTARADINEECLDGMTPLELGFYPEVIEDLLKRNADPNKKATSLRPALLHSAVQSVNVARVKILLMGKADVNLKDSFGKLPKEYLSGANDLTAQGKKKRSAILVLLRQENKGSNSESCGDSN